MKRFKILAAASVLAVMASSTIALAQTPAAPAPATAPAGAPAMDKKAISKACSDQADAQKLHGKARKSFRSKCKAAGGKPA